MLGVELHAGGSILPAVMANQVKWVINNIYIYIDYKTIYIYIILLYIYIYVGSIPLPARVDDDG